MAAMNDYLKKILNGGVMMMMMTRRPNGCFFSKRRIHSGAQISDHSNRKRRSS